MFKWPYQNTSANSTTCSEQRPGTVHECARSRLHEGKTRERVFGMPLAKSRRTSMDPTAGSSEPVWVGNWCLPPDSQGLSGSSLVVIKILSRANSSGSALTRDRLVGRIPTVDDLQAAWLFLQSCAAPRANYCCGILPPHLTADYAAAYDASVARCLAALLEEGETLLPPTGVGAAHLARRFGGLGLRSTVADSNAAHGPRGQDTLRVIRTRAPAAAERLLQALQGDAALPCTAAAVAARGRLREARLRPPVGMPKALARWRPTCSDLVRTPARGRSKAGSDPQPSLCSCARSRRTVSCVAAHANRPFRRPSYQCPTHPPSRHDPQRQLPRAPTAAPAHAPAARAAQMRLPWQLTSLNDHRAACSTSGVLSTRLP